jgi:hypothetical protein
LIPSSGPESGGILVTLGGFNFQPGMTVSVGGNDASPVQVISAHQATCVPPPGLPGDQDVTLTNPDTSTYTLRGGYCYVPPPGWRTASYAIDATPGADLWFFDFQREIALFRSDMVVAGLHTNGMDGLTDAYAEDFFQAEILGYVSTSYLRNFAGTKVSGSSFNISFVGTTPPAPWIPPPNPSGPNQGQQFNRIVFGGMEPLSGINLGRAFQDLSTQSGLPDNGNRENNTRENGCGVFMSAIWGSLEAWTLVTVLAPPLTPSDTGYINGAYYLGKGTPGQDARFHQIREAMAAFARGIAEVATHEVGHSAGLVITSRQQSWHCPDVNSCIMSAGHAWGILTFCAGANSCTAELAAALGRSP